MFVNPYLQKNHFFYACSADKRDYVRRLKLPPKGPIGQQIIRCKNDSLSKHGSAGVEKKKNTVAQCGKKQKFTLI